MIYVYDIYHVYTYMYVYVGFFEAESYFAGWPRSLCASDCPGNYVAQAGFKLTAAQGWSAYLAWTRPWLQSPVLQKLKPTPQWAATSSLLWQLLPERRTVTTAVKTCRNPNPLRVGMQNGISASGNTSADSQKVKHRAARPPINPIWHICPRGLKACPYGSKCAYVLRSTIHNSHKVKSTITAVWWVVKCGLFTHWNTIQP